jgi:DNA-binding transcriptional ArsR family regulator
MSGIRDLFGEKSLTGRETSLVVIEMPDAEAVSLFKTLSDDTTIQIYTAIQEEPKVAPELKDDSETTIQNIHYHLDKLEDAGLIEPVGTWVSDTGVEMTVYGAIYDPLVISFADDEDTATIRQTLRRQFRLLGVVSFVSLVIEYVVRGFREPAGPWRDAGAGGYPGQSLPLADVVYQYPGFSVFSLALVVSLVYVAFAWSRVE